MQISNSIGQGGYPDWESGRAARPEFPARVEEQAARQRASVVLNGESASAQAATATEPLPLINPPTPATRPQTMDETLIRGRLMDGAGGSPSSRRAVAQYTAVAAQSDEAHMVEVMGVDAYA